MVTIRQIEWHGYSIPFSLIESGRSFLSSNRQGFLIKVKTEEGIVGYGDIPCLLEHSINWTEKVISTLSENAKQLIGQSISLSAEINDVKDLFSEMPIFFRFGFELAAFDLLGKMVNKSITELFGNKPRSIKVNWLILDSVLPEISVKQAINAVRLGFDTIKIKVSADKSSIDEEKIRDIRQAVGDSIKIRLDANRKFDFDGAEKFIRSVSKYNIEYIEEPLRFGSIDLLLALKKESPIKIALDESLISVKMAKEYLDNKYIDIMILKPARFGFINSFNIIDIAAKNNIDLVITSSFESGIGIIGLLHFSSCLLLQKYAFGLTTGKLLESDLLKQSPEINNGEMNIPRSSGIGVEPDLEKVEMYSTGIIGCV